MTKEEVIAKINEVIEDNETAVKVLEIVDDYTPEIDTSEIDVLRAEKEDILRRYRERFSEGGEKTETEEVEEEKEKEIDIKEI